MDGDPKPWHLMTFAERQIARDQRAVAKRESDAIHAAYGPRPRTRGDCIDAPRPCPYAACKWHLYLDVNPETGSIKINYPDLEPWELEHSCALDLADQQDGMTLSSVAAMLNITRERVRQIEGKGIRMLKTWDRRLA